MTKKYLQILAGLIVVLVGVLFLFSRAEEGSITRQTKLLLNGVSGDQITKVVVEQGKGKLEIELIGDSWGVVQRSGYPADLNKLRSLLLKLIDLSVSQKVTSNPANFEKLGVADNSYQKESVKGPGRISLLDSSSKEIGVILLGDRKKKNGAKREPGMDEPAGQFIRKAGANEVYLLAEAMEISAAAESIIATELLSFPSAKVKRVLQEKNSGATKEKQFEMLSVKEAEGKVRFDLDVEPTVKQEVQSTVVDSIATGLENVRIQDVQKSSAEATELFDQVTTYELSTGAVYQVQTYLKDGKAYAKFQASFNKTLADNAVIETEASNQKRKADYEQQKKQAEEKKESAPPEFTPLKADIVSEEDMAKENKRYSAWIFEFPIYQIEKYRKGKEDLIKDKAQKTPSGNQ